MRKLHHGPVFVGCVAVLFATLATVSTVLALFQPGSMVLL